MAKVTKSKATQKEQAIRLTTARKPVVVGEPVGRYINPLTDFGFKYIFGTKEFLMDFLNAVLDVEGGIVDLYYDNTERPGRSEDDRTTIFDLFCTLGNGERIIIEMQHHRQEFFQDRTLYYASRLIQEQGEDKKGDKQWGFELSPVYSVNIINFQLDADAGTVNHTVNKYASYVQLFDRDTLEVFYKKLTFLFLGLPYFTKEIHELTNYIDWWMYVLKNLVKLNHLPDALRNRIFEQLFLKAEIAKLSKKDRKEYDRSLKKMRDMNIIIADRDRKIAVLSKDITDRDVKIAVLSKDITDRDKRIAELERKLGLNS